MFREKKGTIISMEQFNHNTMEFNSITNINKILEQNLTEYFTQDLHDIILSNPKTNMEISKIKIRPVRIKEEVLYQSSEFIGSQVFHKNHRREELVEAMNSWLHSGFKQMVVRMKTKDIHWMISKKGKVTIRSNSKNIDQSIGESVIMSHNREKKYIIPEGSPVPFLVDLGVMTHDGKVVKAKYDKFKQINRFLEFIEDILPELEKGKELTMIDFGCGKSYLTFAMYYYLKELYGYQITIIGLDLKKEVIRKCNELSNKYGYTGLKFLEGDISSYTGVKEVDMVVTLHACDTATDYALFKAIQWGATVILSVPCCQHELNGQIENETLAPIFNYGLIKERMAALATDALRGELLEVMGYKTQILEFIDMEHTPKNILIRGIKKKTPSNASKKLLAYERCKEFLGVNPILYRLLLEEYSIM